MGGSERQLTGTFPLDPEDPLNPVDPVDPRACSKIVVFAERVVTFGPGRLSRVMFFDFFQTASCKSVTFETIFGRRPAGGSTPAKSMLEDHKKVREILKNLKKVSFFKTLARRRQHPC